MPTYFFQLQVNILSVNKEGGRLFLRIHSLNPAAAHLWTSQYDFAACSDICATPEWRSTAGGSQRHRTCFEGGSGSRPRVRRCRKPPTLCWKPPPSAVRRIADVEPNPLQCQLGPTTRRPSCPIEGRDIRLKPAGFIDEPYGCGGRSRPVEEIV